MRGALDARREALSHVSDLATALLRDAGHNPTLDTMRRVTATLEAMSVYASIPDAPRAGRLTHDVDPPGFESLASLIPGASMTERTKEPAWVTQSRESGPIVTGKEPIAVSLFRQKDSYWGGPEHSGLLWALELLAWSPHYLSRVAVQLAQLTRLDPGGKWTNRPEQLTEHLPDFVSLHNGRTAAATESH